MDILEKNKQVDFMSNKELFKKAKSRIAAENFSRSSSLDLPFEKNISRDFLHSEIVSDKESTELLTELRVEIDKSFDDLKLDRIYNLREVKANLGI